MNEPNSLDRPGIVTETVANSCLASLFHEVCLEVRRRQVLRNPYAYFSAEIMAALSVVRKIVPDLEQQYGALEAGLKGELIQELNKDDIQRVRNAYDSSLEIAFPAVTVLRRTIHACAGYNFAHSLHCIDFQTLLELEVRAHKSADSALKAMIADFTRRLEMCIRIDGQGNKVYGIEDYVAFGQAYEIFCEMVVYVYLKDRLTCVEPIPREANVKTPDFRCSHLERVFYVEVKSLDIVDGLHRAKDMGLDGLDTNVELERQKLGGARVAIGEREIAPYKSLGDKRYDPASLLTVIEKIKSKINTAIKKDDQFKNGATIAWVCMGRLLIPAGKNDLMPYYVDVDGSSIVSGVLWQACFGKEGGVVTRAAEFAGKGTFEDYLPTNGLCCDLAKPFPGIGLVFMENAKLDSKVYGLFDKALLLPSWDLDEVEGLMCEICDYCNDRSNAKADVILGL